MAKDGDTRRANEPKNRTDGRSKETKRNCNNEKRSVQLGGCSPPTTDLEIVSLELSNAVHAPNHKEDNEEKQQVGEQTVDAEHDKDNGIVAREVAQVVVDPALHLAEVGRLGDTLDVEELGDGA